MQPSHHEGRGRAALSHNNHTFQFMLAKVGVQTRLFQGASTEEEQNEAGKMVNQASDLAMSAGLTQGQIDSYCCANCELSDRNEPMGTKESEQAWLDKRYPCTFDLQSTNEQSDHDSNFESDPEFEGLGMESDSEFEGPGIESWVAPDDRPSAKKACIDSQSEESKVAPSKVKVAKGKTNVAQEKSDQMSSNQSEARNEPPIGTNTVFARPQPKMSAFEKLIRLQRMPHGNHELCGPLMNAVSYSECKSRATIKIAKKVMHWCKSMPNKKLQEKYIQLLRQQQEEEAAKKQADVKALVMGHLSNCTAKEYQTFHDSLTCRKNQKTLRWWAKGG